MKKIYSTFNDAVIVLSFYGHNLISKMGKTILSLLLFGLFSNKAMADFADMAKTVQTQAEAGTSALPVICYFVSAIMVASGFAMIYKKGKEQHSQTGWGGILVCLVGGSLLACVTFMIDSTADSVGADVSK